MVCSNAHKCSGYTIPLLSVHSMTINEDQNSFPRTTLGEQ